MKSARHARQVHACSQRSWAHFISVCFVLCSQQGHKYPQLEPPWLTTPITQGSMESLGSLWVVWDLPSIPAGSPIGDVANSKHPLLIILKVQLCLRATRRSATALVRYPHKLAKKLYAGKNFVKNLVTAQTQLRSYSEQQRVFGNSNICNSRHIIMWRISSTAPVIISSHKT